MIEVIPIRSTSWLTISGWPCRRNTIARKNLNVRMKCTQTENQLNGYSANTQLLNKYACNKELAEMG
jgi:hypothetical protein